MIILDLAYKLTRWCLGAVFIYAGFMKLLNPSSFAVLIEAYGVLPDSLLMPSAVFLPALEIIAGVGLFFDVQWSLTVITGLLVIFIALLCYGIRMGMDIDCGCFGADDPETEAFDGLRRSLYRDLIMLAGIAFLFWWRRFRAIKPLEIKFLINNFSQKEKKDACT